MLNNQDSQQYSQHSDYKHFDEFHFPALFFEEGLPSSQTSLLGSNLSPSLNKPTFVFTRPNCVKPNQIHLISSDRAFGYFRFRMQQSNAEGLETMPICFPL
jgi:hypothetical protein